MFETGLISDQSDKVVSDRRQSFEKGLENNGTKRNGKRVEQNSESLKKLIKVNVKEASIVGIRLNIMGCEFLSDDTRVFAAAGLISGIREKRLLLLRNMITLPPAERER